jgi:hypothetical protein
MLSFLSRALGADRNNAYRAPGAYTQLASGLSVFDASQCAGGNPAPPGNTDPSSLAQMIEQYVFRTPGRNIAAPRCAAQGTFGGFSTLFPQLRADPPPPVAAAKDER